MKCALVIALVACTDKVPPRQPPAVPAPDQLRVMSYNVNFGIAGDRRTIDAIEAAGADVVFLQETNACGGHAILHRLEGRYPHHRFADPEGWPAGGMGVLSKHPIVALDQLPKGAG